MIIVRAVASDDRYGIHVRRILTDTGSSHRPVLHA